MRKLKSGNAWILVATATVSMALAVAHAKEAVWLGRGDLSRTFSDPANWGTLGAPEAGDRISIKSENPLVIRDDDVALASTISGFYWQSSADVIWDVSGDTSSVAAFGYW